MYMNLEQCLHNFFKPSPIFQSVVASSRLKRRLIYAVDYILDYADDYILDGREVMR